MCQLPGTTGPVPFLARPFPAGPLPAGLVRAG